MAVGAYGVVAVTTDAKTWTWGRDGLGALGLGNLSVWATPVSVRSLANATRVAVAENSMAAVDESGNVWAWGRNDPDIRYGGNGRTPVSIPARVAISGVKDIAAGYNYFVYLKTDGTVWSTGQQQPIPVPGVSAVASIAAGPGQHFYITTSGELWALGDNRVGQLGDGTFTYRSSPTRITGVPAMRQVSVDADHTIAVSTAGEVWAWGSNFTGTLGNGQTGGVTPTPQKVAGLSDVVEVSLGNFHALARRSDGTVWSWGAPWYGAALGRSGNALIPARVEGLDQVVSIAAGAGSSYAIRADGSVWGWGGMVCPFQVCPTPGDGTLVQRDRPVVVLREEGAGNLDSNDWFLDAKPGTPKTIPTATIPKVISVAESLSSSGLLNVDASVNVRLSDQSKTLGLYVVGLVAPAFLDQVTTAPGRWPGAPS
jgi:alpha-tubulin suppressor-like RCC1 family protein